jgi:hypothetical protein
MSADDTIEIDDRVCELFELATQRVCEMLDVTPAEAAVLWLHLASHAIDQPAITAPPSRMSLKHAPRNAEPEPPAPFLIMSGR